MYRIYFLSGKNTMLNFKELIDKKYKDNNIMGTNNIGVFNQMFLREYIKAGIDGLVICNISLTQEESNIVADLLSKIQKQGNTQLKISIIQKSNKDLNLLINTLNKAYIGYKLVKTETTMTNLEKYILFDIYKEIKTEDVKLKLQYLEINDSRYLK